MEIKLGELKQDAALLKRHAKDALQRGAVGGKVYAFEDFGKHHAQSVRDALKADPATRGRIRVAQGQSGWRRMIVK